jgi:Fur family ferric uptake transcriptional regulator
MSARHSSDTHRADYAARVHQVFSDHLATHGLRLTHQRSRIVDHLLESDKHESLEEIYEALKAQGIGRATVFRTLRMLESCELVSAITGPKGTKRFELDLERPHHDHLICVQCGLIQEVHWPKLEKIQQRVCRELGFKPQWHRHEIFGLCASCAKKKGSA